MLSHQAHAGHVASRGGKSGLSNKPIFPQPLCLSKQNHTAKNPKLTQVEHVVLCFQHELLPSAAPAVLMRLSAAPNYFAPLRCRDPARRAISYCTVPTVLRGEVLLQLVSPKIQFAVQFSECFVCINWPTLSDLLPLSNLLMWIEVLRISCSY